MMPEAREAKRTQLELQQLQAKCMRYADVYVGRVVEETGRFQRSAANPELRSLISIWTLSQVNSAYSIAAGDSALVSALDLVTLAVLSRMVIDDSIVPRFPSETGPLLAMHRELEQRAWKLTDEFLTPVQTEDFRNILVEWRASNPLASIEDIRALSQALLDWDASRKGTRNGPRMGFPRFKTKARAVKKFSFTTGTIRVEPDRNHLTLPRLGRIKTHESTRKLARRVGAGTARILRATVRLQRGRWLVSLTCLVQRDTGRPPHVKPGVAVVGIDAGVKDLLVVADPDGSELARHRAPRELKRAQRALRALHRKAARQVGPWMRRPGASANPRGAGGALNMGSGARMPGWPTCAPTGCTSSPPGSARPTL